MHELGTERNVRQLRHAVQEGKPEPIGEHPVGRDLITCHRAGPGKAVVRGGPQRLVGRCQVPDLNAVAGRMADGRQTELVAKTTTRTDGTVLMSPRMRVMPRPSDSWLLCQGATSGSTSRIIVLTDNFLALANRSASPVTRT